mgnify:CR=1 FL=1
MMPSASLSDAPVCRVSQRRRCLPRGERRPEKMKSQTGQVALLTDHSADGAWRVFALDDHSATDQVDIWA